MDHKTLENWLQTRSREDAIIIAQRAALRVFAFYASNLQDDRALKPDLTSLPVLRSILSSGVACRYSAPEVIASAKAASDAANAAAVAVNPKYTAGSVAAATAAKAAANTNIDALTAVSASASAAAAADAPEFQFWTEVQFDVATRSEGAELSLVPLWNRAVPNVVTLAEARALDIMSAEYGSADSFWHRWWAGAKSGHWLSWNLQRDIALIPDEVWLAGIQPVMAEITRLEAGYVFASTDNGEDVEQNPETGKLYLVPKSTLPADLGSYVRRKMTKAVELFDGQLASQMYGALQPDLDMLSAALRDAENMPIELYDACASANRRLVLRAQRGECAGPDQDPLIGDYHQRMVDIAYDILSHDPMARDVLDRRNRQPGNDAFLQGSDFVTQGTAIVLPATEGRLNTALQVDGQTIIDPNADSEERKAAGFRWVGRMSRVFKRAFWEVMGGVFSQVGSRAADAGLALVSREVLKQVWTIILRYLGFG